LQSKTTTNLTLSPGQVKSYANVVTKVGAKAVSAVKSLPTTWKWTYTGENIVANVAYDLFTGKTADSARQEYEIMIWLGALGGAGPISATGKPIATVKLAGQNWKLYNGKNSQLNVFSFVAEKNVNNFKGDLVEFISYLTSKQGLPKNQILQSVGAGTEPFSGKNAKLTVSEYSMKEQ
jgi:xyloglucan-specific endo-beta-1,4-glucanase